MFSAVLCIYARTCLALEGDFGWVLIGQKMIAFEENSWQVPHRPFFHFGNPFQMILPKGSQMTPNLSALLNTFEETLAGRLRKLNPKDNNDVLSLSWMKLAMESLCGTRNDIKTLIAEIDLPVSAWDEKWIDVYLDISVKLLDICIVFSSEIAHLNQGHLFLQFVLHNLNSASSKQFIRARSSVDDWKNHIASKNPRVENCSTILDKLVESLDLPKVKNSAKGKLLMRAMYGVKVLTVSVCSVFAAAFSGFASKLLDLNVAKTYIWAQAFNDLQSNVNGEIRNVLSSGRVTVLKELEAVDGIVKHLYPMIQDDVALAEEEAFKNSTSDLERKAQNLSQGLDLLTKEVDGFFQILLTGRDALLSKLRSGGAVSDRMLMGNVEGQVVR
ncbi:protein BPS1, chloroplastic-like isoform X1 [Rosa rugosa]|uniref:protein BPS1, chloroplastic-like isoform X1 n=1 Tax=Rosa rugosa TaxID=74645 RepID=UPI002B403F7A|nr:protein BPS1, chloroplastic-like isoform X1 [Rosa rugosa]